MAKRKQSKSPAGARPWFVCQMTMDEANTLAAGGGMFLSDSRAFPAFEKRVRKLAKSCGYEYFILIGPSGDMSYGTCKEGREDFPRDRRLLLQWTAEDRGKVLEHVAKIAQSP